MKGKYVFDVENLPEITSMIFNKAINLGCNLDTDRINSKAPLVFVNLTDGKVFTKSENYQDYKTKYGFGEYSTELSVVQFLQLEKPVPKVALALVITDDFDRAGETPPRMVTEADLKEFDFEIGRSHIMAAAEQACSALGV